MVKKGFSSREITGTAVLLALVIVLQAFGGTVSIGAVQLNFTLIPIALGAILFGPWVGLLLGFACGVVVLVQVVMGLAPFYVVIWAYNPVVTVFTCIVKTTVAGFVSGLLYRLLEKKNSLVAVFVASGIVPVINTALFVVGCLCMSGSIQIFQSSIPEMAGTDVLAFILVGLVTFNFFVEFAINLLVSSGLHRVIGVVGKKFRRK